MAITVGTDTYGTVAEADTYFAARFGFDKWIPLTELEKEKYLVSAAQQEDVLCLWYGEKSDEDQLLAFPRTPDADPTPLDIKHAQFEIAYAIVDTNSVSTDGGDPLTELKAGSVTLKFDPSATGNPLVNDLASSLLSAYGICGSGSTTIIPLVLA